MINAVIYVFLYNNLTIILNKLYYSKYNTINNKLLSENNEYYNSMIQLNTFTLFVYLIIFIKHVIQYYKLNPDIRYNNDMNNKSFTLALIYINYVIYITFNNNITIYEYETLRHVMWLFATPLMIQMYSNANNIDVSETKIHYNIIPIIINILIYPYKNTKLYFFSLGICYCLLYKFMKRLYINRNYKFSNIYLLIWFIFCIIHVGDVTNIMNKNAVNYYYLCSDVIGKVLTSIIINDFNEREYTIKDNVDLQTVNFISYMLNQLKNYQIENKYLTNYCQTYIQHLNKQMSRTIPENNDFLKKDLLQKILPLGFDKDYIDNINKERGLHLDLNNQKTMTQINKSSKEFNMICILFTDIVNYTELAKKCDENIIFTLLNTIYVKFDTIIKKYQHLQKVETIGDAYMVVGDIFRNDNNHKVVIKEIILLAMEFVKEIKNIETPDNETLSIRIGINMGNVSIGILGYEIPRLCVVGNAVNVAARLQSTAEVDTIQMSRHIYEKLDEIDFDEKFEIISKENIFLKNIGSVTTYNIPPPSHIVTKNKKV